MSIYIPSFIGFFSAIHRFSGVIFFLGVVIAVAIFITRIAARRFALSRESAVSISSLSTILLIELSVIAHFVFGVGLGPGPHPGLGFIPALFIALLVSIPLAFLTGVAYCILEMMQSLRHPSLKEPFINDDEQTEDPQE